MKKRKIIKIDEDKCTGCRLCIPNCPEGAIQIIDGKARLISDLFCDGLGACLGHCPEGAITIEERQADAYDERKVMENIVKHGANTIKAHLEHLRGHGEKEYLKEALGYLKDKGIKDPVAFEAHAGHHAHAGVCPGSLAHDFRNGKNAAPGYAVKTSGVSELGQWPVQITLVNERAPYFKGADLLIAADCVPFAYARFHDDLLKGKILLVGCPKLDDIEAYREKISNIVKDNDIRSITYAHMEVPCCSGLIGVIEDAIAASGKNTPFKDTVISIRGEKLK